MPFLGALIPALGGVGGAVSAAGSAIGGIAGALAGKSKEEQAAILQQKAIAEMEKIGVPSAEAQRLALQNPEYVAQWALQQESAEQMGPSRMEGIVVSPEFQQAQMQALQGLSQRAELGLTPEDEAALRSVQRQSAQRGAAQQASILQNLQQRGAAGSGMELAARMAAGQGQAQGEAEAADRLAAEAFAQKQAALARLAEQSSAMRRQEFGEKSDVASAADRIAEFNALQRAGVQQRNISAANRAAEEQARIRQDLESRRADIANRQELYNKELIRQEYLDKMGKARSMAGQYQGQAEELQKRATADASNIKQLGADIGAIGGRVATEMQKSQEQKAQDDLAKKLATGTPSKIGMA